MRPEWLVIIHVVLGSIGIYAALWLFIELLNSSPVNQGRIKIAGILIFLFIWLSYFVGGYFYVKFYTYDKTAIMAGPFPWAHSFFMEVKEHIFFVLLMLATFVPIVLFREDLLPDKGGRSLLLSVAMLIFILGLFMDLSGALIIMGAKCGLVGR